MAEEDRISSLPDCLLLEIISRIKIGDKEERLMSTKEVIKTTSTLSKRWQHLWTRLPTLVFINEDAIKHGNNGFNDLINYFLFIDETLKQCPTDVNLKKFKLQILTLYYPEVKVNSWIRYAITRNVQEIDLRITDMSRYESFYDELFFKNACLISMKLSRCTFNPPNGAIRWDKLICLCIDTGRFDEDIIGKILSGSPCLETLELNYCNLVGRIPKSLFGNFGVLERLSCLMKTYERFSYVDELFFNKASPTICMKLSRCVLHPPNGAICRHTLTFLCIHGKLGEDSIGKILSGSPCLETLQLNDCYGIRRIDVTSKSVKNFVLSGYGYRHDPWADYYIDTLEINAPYILSLTIIGEMCLGEFFLENVSSLVKADLNYLGSNFFSEEVLLGDIEEELLRGLLSRLGHVNEIVLGDDNCLKALSHLEAKGFQFRKGSDLRGSFPDCYKVFSLTHK